MRDVKLTKGHDIDIDGGGIMVSGADAVMQRNIEELKTFSGECFLDTTLGIPYQSDVFGKKPDYARIESILIKKICAIEGNTELLEFSLQRADGKRVLNLSYSVMTMYNVRLKFGGEIGDGVASLSSLR